MAKDPRQGERWEHIDGGTIYVWRRWPKRLLVSRRPWGDSQADPRWMRLATFERDTTRRLFPSEVTR